MSNFAFPKDREKFLTLVHDLNAIQPPPTSALRLINLCQDDEAGTDEIISVIESEPAIAARVLAVANSPLYGYTRQIGNIGHAVVILGIKNITQLAVTFGTSSIYFDGDHCQELKRTIYRHSLACALVARSLAEYVTHCEPEEAFLGGLLHDIGKIVMLQLVPDEYELLATTKIGDELLESEIDTFGISHERIGGICAQRWGLPVGIQKAISNHHGNSEEVPTPLSVAVEAADRIAHCKGIGGLKHDDAAISVRENQLFESLSDELLKIVVESAESEFTVLDSAS